MDCPGEIVPVLKHRLLKSDKLVLKTDFDAVKRIALSMLVAGVAAGVSAVWNMILDFIYRKIDEAMPTSDELTLSIQEGLDEYDEN